MYELSEKDTTNMTLDVRFEEDGTINIRAMDRDTGGDSVVSFVELPNAFAHNAVMQMLTSFAKRLANKEGIPVRFEDV